MKEERSMRDDLRNAPPLPLLRKASIQTIATVVVMDRTHVPCHIQL
jgi:hypothetical protein